MREDKKRRLEAKGWRLGSTRAFLGLSREEEAYIEIRLTFAEALRRRRLRKKVTQGELARLVKSSQSRIAKMEAGDASVSLDLLVRTLLALGTSRRALAAILSRTSTSSAA